MASEISYSEIKYAFDECLESLQKLEQRIIKGQKPGIRLSELLCRIGNLENEILQTNKNRLCECYNNEA